MKATNKSSKNSLKITSFILSALLFLFWIILPVFNSDGFSSVSFDNIFNKIQSMIWLVGILLFALFILFKAIATFSNKPNYLLAIRAILCLSIIIIASVLFYFCNSGQYKDVSNWSVKTSVDIFDENSTQTKVLTKLIALLIAILSNVISFIFFIILEDPKNKVNNKKPKSKSRNSALLEEEQPVSPNLNGDKSSYIDEPIFATVEQSAIDKISQYSENNSFETNDGSDNIQGRVDQLRNMLLNSNWKKMGFSNRKEVEQELEKAETIAKATQGYVDTMAETFEEDYNPNMETPKLSGQFYDESIALNSISDSMLDNDFNDTRYMNSASILERDRRINREVADLFNDITQAKPDDSSNDPSFKDNIFHTNDKTLEVKNPYVETIIPRRLRGKNISFEAPIGNVPFSQSQKRVRPSINPNSIKDNIDNFIVGENDRIWNELKKQDRQILNKTADFSNSDNNARFSTKKYDNEGQSYTFTSRKEEEPTFNIEDTAYYEHVETPLNITRDRIQDPLIDKKDQTESSEPTVDWNNG